MTIGYDRFRTEAPAWGGAAARVGSRPSVVETGFCVRAPPTRYWTAHHSTVEPFQRSPLQGDGIRTPPPGLT